MPSDEDVASRQARLERVRRGGQEVRGSGHDDDKDRRARLGAVLDRAAIRRLARLIEKCSFSEHPTTAGYKILATHHTPCNSSVILRCLPGRAGIGNNCPDCLTLTLCLRMPWAHMETSLRNLERSSKGAPVDLSPARPVPAGRQECNKERH